MMRHVMRNTWEQNTQWQKTADTNTHGEARRRRTQRKTKGKTLITYIKNNKTRITDSDTGLDLVLRARVDDPCHKQTPLSHLPLCAKWYERWSACLFFYMVHGGTVAWPGGYSPTNRKAIPIPVAPCLWAVPILSTMINVQQGNRSENKHEKPWGISREQKPVFIAVLTSSSSMLVWHFSRFIRLMAARSCRGEQRVACTIAETPLSGISSMNSALHRRPATPPQQYLTWDTVLLRLISLHHHSTWDTVLHTVGGYPCITTVSETLCCIW